MATRVKESSTSNSHVGKEKKDSHTSSHTKLTKTSTSSETHSCTTDHKQRIKSYLKPTLRSKTESFKNKKIGSSSSTVDNHNDHSNQHKATLMNRRRSFDKPPSAASRFQKSLVSPGPRDRNAYLKSSTFSSKSSSKPINIGHDNQKLSNATHSKLQYRPVSNKSHTKTATVSGGVNVKKNTTQNKNKEAVSFSASASSTKVPKSGNCVMTHTSTDHIEVTQEAYQSLVDHHDQIAEIEQSHEDHDHHEVQEVLSEDQLRSFENSNSEHVEENINEDKSGEQGDSSTTSEEIKAKLSDGTSDSIQKNEGESNVTNDINSEESSVDPSGTKDEVVKEDIVKEGNDYVEEAKEEENEKNEVKSLEEEDIVINVISGNEEEGGTSSKKEEEEVEKINGEKQEAAKVEVKSQGEQGNKKESPAAYNDVIEETASKLLEKRKNKVRALVGAFETVIDYESK